jgi:hypothetical protein
VLFFDKPADEFNLLGDVGHGGGFDMRRKQVERFAVRMEGLRPAAGEFFEGQVFRLGLSDGFVIHIRDVADMKGGEADTLGNPAQDILKNEGSEVSDVGWAIDGGTAAIHAKRMAIEGMEDINLPT